jgi:hypothetical protein
MPLVKIDPSLLADARAASADSRARYANGDANVGEAEATLILSVAQALKDAGCTSPLEIWLDVAVNPLSWRGTSDYAAGEQPANPIV